MAEAARPGQVVAEERLFTNAGATEAKDMEMDADAYTIDSYSDEGTFQKPNVFRRIYDSRPTYKEIKNNVLFMIDSARCTVSLTYDDFMMIVTMYVLFEADFRYLCMPKSADGFFEVLVSLSFALFLLELVLNCWAKSQWEPRNGNYAVLPKGYLLSFFFWLDLLAILSLFPDVPWLAEPLGIEGLSSPVQGEGGSRFGAIGSKAGRVLRMVRLVRLVRIYKVAMYRRQQKRLLEEMDEAIERVQM